MISTLALLLYRCSFASYSGSSLSSVLLPTEMPGSPPCTPADPALAIEEVRVSTLALRLCAALWMLGRWRA